MDNKLTISILALGVSALALIISGLTFWLTRVKRGIVKMTRPSIIFFGPDGRGKDHKKIFIRTLLYSTSEKGKYIQNMFVRVQRGESIQNFNVWVYDNNGLVRGSGLFINKSGIACNHHFLLPKDGSNYEFLYGTYTIQVFVEAVDEQPKKIFEQKLELTQNQQKEMLSNKVGIYFDWAPNTQNYFSHVDEIPRQEENYLDIIDKLV